MEKIIISIGSKNPTKVDALKNILIEYEMFKQIEVIGVEVETGVSDQPMSVDETIQGAKNRAKFAYNKVTNSKYAFGIESGFMKVESTKQGYMQICVCAIFDGQNYHIGFSPSFECPIDIMNYILTDNLNLAQAANKSGYTADENVNKSEGVVGVLTKGKITRTDYSTYAIIMAMIHIDSTKN